MEDKTKKTILCWNYRENKKYTIADYEEDLIQKNKEGIAEFMYKRFSERYIEPFEDNPKKNGFSMMAIACLMIEALECFRQGLSETSKKKSVKFFKKFFSHCDEFIDFRGMGKQFYKHIRCGILHQAETTGGWIISREGDLLDKKSKTINATKFLERLKTYLSKYKMALGSGGFDSEIWINFKKKMDAIIKNCQP